MSACVYNKIHVNKVATPQEVLNASHFQFHKDIEKEQRAEINFINMCVRKTDE